MVIKLIECKRIVGEKNGNKYDFLAYEGYTDDNLKCTFKFTKDAKNVPQEEGVFACYIENEDINKDLKSMYRTFWIKNVVQATKIANSLN